MALSRVASILGRRKRSTVNTLSKRPVKLSVEPLEDRLAPATKIWTGFGLTNNMSNQQNWLGNVAPTAGDDLVFPPSIQTLVNNDFPAGTEFNSLLISGQGYIVNGLTMQLTGGLFNSNRVFNGFNTLTLDIDFVGNQTVSSTLENSQLIINGTTSLIGSISLTLDGAGQVLWNNSIDGSGNIIKEGIGQHFLRANNTIGAGYTGNITINNGVLFANQDGALGSFSLGSTIVNNGGTLCFEGSGNNRENITARGMGFGGRGALDATGGINYNGNLTVTGDIAIGAGNNLSFFFNQAGTGGTITQSGGSWDLYKVGTGNLRLDATVGLTGELFHTGGLIQVVNGGQLNFSNITINSGAQLELNNTGLVNGNRIPDTTDIHLNGGFFNLTGRSTVNIAEFVGDIFLDGGHNQIRMDGIGTATGTHLLLQSTALLRSDGATVRFTQAGIVLGSNTVNFSNRILFSAAPTLTASGTSAAILPYAQRDVGTGTGGFVTYMAAALGSYHGIVSIVDAGAVPATLVPATSATILAAAPTQNNVRYTAAAAETVTVNTTINSLDADAGGTITINAGVTLTIGSGGFMNSGGTLTITGNGTLRFNSPAQLEGFIFGTNVTSFNVEIIGPGLESLNISAEQDVDINFGGPRSNMYEGVTRINAGDLVPNKANGLVSIPGDMIVGDGTGGIWQNASVFDRIIIPDGRTGQLADAVPDPTIAAAIATVVATGSTLPAGNWFIRHTFFNSLGETLASSPSTQVTTDGLDDGIVVVLPVGPPGSVNGVPVGAVGVKIYLSDSLATPGSETFYASFAAGPANFTLSVAPALGQPAPPLSNTTRAPDLRINGGGIMDMPNTGGLRYVFRDITLQASNAHGLNNEVGDAMLQTEASIVTVTGTVTVLKPETTSYIHAGRANIGFARNNFGVNTNTLELGLSTGSGDRIFNVEDGAAPNDLIISNIITDPGTFRLIKNGAGSLQLRLNNNIGEEVVINGGRLAVYNNSASSTYTVNGSGELAGGFGATNITAIVGPTVNISGTVRPGTVPDPNEISGSPDFNNDTRGILQANGNVNFLSGGTLVLEVAGFTVPGRDYDRFAGGGNVNIGLGTTLILDVNGVSSPGTVFGVLTYISRFGQFANVQVINNLFGLFPILNYNQSGLDITFVNSTHPVSNNIIAVGPNKGRPGNVEVWDANSNTLMYTVPAFTASAHVEVAVGDVNNDSVLDVIAAQKGVIKIYDGAHLENAPLLTFKPFGGAYKGIVYLAMGDLDNQVGDDLAVGRGAGASLVRGWSSFTFTSFNVNNRLFNFKAYPGTSGVRLALGNTNGSGDDEIVTVPGAKRITEVRVYNSTGTLLDSTQPYSSSFKKGGYVATGDFNGDGNDDIVVGPGASNPGATIQVLNGTTLNPLAGSIPFQPFPGATQAVRVAVTDYDNDGDADIVAALGTIGRTIRGFEIDGDDVDTDILAFDAAFTGGLCIGAGSN